MMHAPALEAARGMAATPKNIQAIAKDFGEEAARWAFTQWELRRRASAKFGRAEEMLFDREGLEMATHEILASFHATLFPPNVLVRDLTVGIGADLIALAGRGPVEGYEIDPERVEMAQHNLSVYGVQGLVHLGDGLTKPELDYFFADPARRSGGNRRSLHPEDYEPPLSKLAEVARDARGAVLKLSPLLADRYLDALGAQVVFVSHQRECKEALALFGECRRGKRGAVHVESGEWLESGDEPMRAETPGTWLYEADPAAIRSDALDAFGMDALGDSNGYLTADMAVSSPWLRPFRVLYSGRADLRETKQKLKELGSSTPVIKQRGAGIDPESLRKQLRLSGTRPLILAIWTIGKSLRHTILDDQLT